MQNKNPLVFILLILNFYFSSGLLAQNLLNQEVDMAVQSDLKNGNYNSLFSLFKKYNLKGVKNNYKITYASQSETQLSSKSQLLINERELAYGEEWEIISMHDNAAPIYFFYNRDGWSPDHVMTFVKISEYFDKDQTVQNNVDIGFRRLQSEIRSKRYQTVIILDDFGLNTQAKKALYTNFKDAKENVLYINRTNYNKYLSESAAYLVEFKLVPETKVNTQDFIMAFSANQKLKNIYLISYLPEKNAKYTENHYLASVQLFFNTLRSNPNFEFHLILLDRKDWNAEKNAMNEAVNNFADANFIIVMHNLNSLTSSNELNLEGVGIQNAQKSVYGTAQNFKINFAEKPSTKEEVIPSQVKCPVLIVGGANTDSYWQTYSESKLSGLESVINNIIVNEVKLNNNASN